MATTTPNIGLTLPVGTEKVSRQIINQNMSKIDEKVGAVPNGQDLQSQVTSLSDQMATLAYKKIKSLSGNSSVSFELPSYSDCALIFTATSNTNGAFYIYANGYITAIKEATGIAVSLSGDYKTITVSNSLTAQTYACCISCANPSV